MRSNDDLKPKKRDKKPKPIRVHLQARLHSHEEGEDDAIDEWFWFDENGFTERAAIRECLLLHREFRRNGYIAAKVRNPEAISRNMTEQLSEMNSMLSLVLALLNDVVNNNYVPSENVKRTLGDVTNKIGIDMNASHLAGRIIEVAHDDDDDEEGW